MPSMITPTVQDLFDLFRAEAALKRPELTFDEGELKAACACVRGGKQRRLLWRPTLQQPQRPQLCRRPPPRRRL